MVIARETSYILAKQKTICNIFLRKKTARPTDTQVICFTKRNGLHTFRQRLKNRSFEQRV